ncbi:carboxylate-amine ligase [Tautonia plasticadhaerens]|uniref:Putative glutamate--cysteine ligase 2 n=1 Tax=Tautonia plasticadhaerens TaxID=2527974 RepID=A0A518HFL7_9BACT|nr:YbdK family carboxylate-amine ligase [Tautonia plasticadhaerens]QDV39586.1 Carboxylate-amine ligase YbdK [Tautonia plasticadhaerens]
MSHPAFRGSDRPTLGVELELQLVDARTLATRDACDRVLAAIPAAFAGAIKPEMHACCVEVATGVCIDTADVADDLGAKLRALAAAAHGLGMRAAWGGTHPFTHWQHQGITPTPRYRALVERYREPLLRQATFGLHVHVGVPDGDAAIRACDGIRAHLPTLAALAANSPFWCGRATGMRAHRVEIIAATPTGGLPPRLGDWDHFAALVDRLSASGCIESLKDLWWDVRPSPANGTVEVRVCDMPPDLPSVLALAALIQCLVHALARDAGRDAAGGPEEVRSLLTRQNRWAASRHGLDADLIDPRTGRSRSARDVVRRLAHDLRGEAEALGCVADLERAWAMADGPTGADRQLVIYERTGDLTAVARGMVPDLDDGSIDMRPSGHDRPIPAPGVGRPAYAVVPPFAPAPGHSVAAG